MQLPTVRQRVVHVCVRFRILFFFVVAILFLFVANDSYIGNHGESPLASLSIMEEPEEPPRIFIPGEISRLWNSTYGLDEDHFTTHTGKMYNISEDNYRWRKNLGKKVLILDIDTRLDSKKKGSILNTNPLRRDKITGQTAGMLNHFLFALIHGYDYRVVRAPPTADRHGTWVKVPIVKQALKSHDIVVFLDSDAVIQHLDLPLEWMMSLWNVTDRTIVTMAEDPNTPGNRDEKNWVLWNTGFMIAQQSDRAQDMFTAWEECPAGRRYPDCRKWAEKWSHEQAAFGNFVRYDYKDEVLGLPCREANGAPYIGDCEGFFVSHHWREKDKPIEELYDRVSADFVTSLHQEFVTNMDKYFNDLKDYKYRNYEFALESAVI